MREPDAEAPTLRRVLTLGPLIFYGLGVIVGAGIYVAIGVVVARAGGAAPLSFIVAGVVAALTGLCYAELGSRFPDAAGCVSYVRHGFDSEVVARLTGLAMTVAVAVSAASIARGTAHYLVVLMPLPDVVLTAVVVIGFTIVAAIGVRESVGLAAVIGGLEVLGLIVASIVGFLTAPSYDLSAMVPADRFGWLGVLSGAFVAYFAFLGFETLANLGEEVRDPRRTLPLGVLGAVAASVLLYVVVVTAVVLRASESRNPLLDLFPDDAVLAFAALGALAVANGVLVQIIMLARLFYGMARRGQLPAILGAVHPTTRTPLYATVGAGAVVLATAIGVPFERLLVLANLLTLTVFVMVDLALWRVHRRAAEQRGGFVTARWVPPVAALSSVLLMVAALL